MSSSCVGITVAAAAVESVCTGTNGAGSRVPLRLLTGPVPVEVAVLVWVDRTWRVTVCLAVNGVVTVTGNGDALACVDWIVVDRLAVRPCGGVQLGEVGQRPEDTTGGAVCGLGSSDVIRS